MSFYKNKYWLIVLSLFILQALFTFFSSDQLRMEEVKTSIRDVFWFQNRQIYTVEYSNIGWYGTLVVVYNSFGFHLYAAKFFRLFLHLISLLCLAVILKKYLTEKVALVPLLVIGLSPMWLFFNILQVPYGLDLQYLPIVIFLILHSRVVVKLSGLIVAMIAWLSYPTFVFYLPALAILFYLNLSQVNRMKWVILGVVTFLLPLVATLAYVKEPLKLLYDPQYNRGLFTAGGGFKFDADLFIKSLSGSFENLFIRPSSYYLEVYFVEFSHLLPFLSFCFVLWASTLIYKRFKNFRLVLVLSYLTMFFNLGVICFTIDGGIPGGRRNTPFLAGFYVLFTVVWLLLYTQKLQVIKSKALILGLLLLILVHHLLVYPFNLMKAQEASYYAYNSWFATALSPLESIKQYLDSIKKEDLLLNCETNIAKGDKECVYSMVFASLEGECFWNHLKCNKVYGYFPTVGYQKLSIETIKYWQDLGYEH